MGDLARGMRVFRAGMRDDDATAPEAGQLAEAADQKRI
jgi:hypothetical protein